LLRFLQFVSQNDSKISPNFLLFPSLARSVSYQQDNFGSVRAMWARRKFWFWMLFGTLSVVLERY